MTTRHHRIRGYRATGRLIATALVLTAMVPLSEAARLQLVVEAPAELQAVARRVEALGQADFSLSFDLTGADANHVPIRVVLAPEQAPIAGQLPAWVSGFAVADQRLIVLFPHRVRSYPDRNLEVLLHHEITHLLVADAAAYRPVPRWFNEGVATVAAREWGLEDRTRYALAVVGKGPRSTAELDAAFGGQGSQVARAYALSSAFLRFLRDRHGNDLSARLLALLASGLSFEQAFLRCTGEPLMLAERAFFEDEAFWSTWVPFLTSSTGLWMAITTLALVAIKRRRDRSRALHELWEQQENEQYGTRPTDLDESTDDEEDPDQWVC